uniref:dynamin GTPase n=1 Tax=Hemiscolopendra marginata TaxID=943146 RepID=A0A646QDW3_9MYRI
MSNEGMQDLIGLINKLQESVTTAGVSLGSFNLPQIAVVGGQSDGKSSVLESFLGRDLLPRGNGIVTRRPLVLQLNPCLEDYAEFVHLPGQKFTDFNEVREEIMKETDRVAGKGKGISNEPMIIRVYSPNVLQLTLMDLPGLARVPVGEQPADIEERTRNMILEHINNENMLILAVTPANQDLAGTDALTLAARVDPKRERTIGVITKLDLMDDGTNAKDILENKVYPLKRGYVGVVNRSQRDIDSGKDIEEAQEDEREFFNSNPSYKHLAHRMGSRYLQMMLNKQLTEHIRQHLPKLRSDINKQNLIVKKQLEKMNAFEEATPEKKYQILIRLLQEFNEELKLELEGHSINVRGKHTTAGVKINRSFYNEIYELLNQVSYPDKHELAELIENLHGYRSPLYTSELSFDICVKDLIKNYEEPMLHSVDIISNIILSAISDCSQKFSDYHKLKETVCSILTDILSLKEKSTKDHLSAYIEAQCAFMNIKHPEFVRIPSEKEKGYIIDNGINSHDSGCENEIDERLMNDSASKSSVERSISGLIPAFGNSSAKGMLSREVNKDENVEVLIEMADRYLSIIDKTIRDIVPKYIIQFLVNATLDFCKVALIVDISQKKNWIQLMEESPEEVEKKKQLFCIYETTIKAMEILNQVSFL